MINLTVVIDNDEAVKKLKELQNVAKTTTSSVVKDSERIDASWQQMKNTLMSLAAGVSFAALTKQIVSIRGEVQQLEVAFETMLGSKKQADALMTEIIDLAAKTPFGLQDVSNATKMLLAYGSTAEQVTDEIKMLGNIASGLSIPLNDMIYLYGTTRTQGRMFTQDLRQFMGRGIPLAEELAKQFGVTKDKVGELVTAGKVGFDEMAKALSAMTSEGGKFNGLMDKQSQTISGQISNLEDAIYQMFNEIGESSEGVVSGTIDVVASLVENYERVGRVLMGLVATYGTYKAAIVAYNVVTAIAANAAKGMALAEQIRMVATIAAEKAQKALNKAMLLNPWVLAATAVAGLVTLLISQKNETEKLREAQEKYDAEKQEVINKEEEHKRVIEELTSIAGDEATATELRKDALHQLIREYPEVFAKYRTEAEMLKNILDIKREIDNIEKGRSITQLDNELADIDNRLSTMKPEGNYDKEINIPAYPGDLRYLSKLSIDWNAYSDEQKIERKVLEARREEILQLIKEQNRQKYLQNAPSFSDKELNDEIAVLKRVQDLIKMRDAAFKTPGSMMKGLDYDNEIIGLGFGGYDEKELQAELKILEAEKAARDADKKSAADWVEEKKKAYETAQKAYNDYVKNNKGKVREEEFQEEAKRLKENAEMAKKEYDKYKPSVDKSEEKKEKELAEKNAKLAEDAVKANAEATISAMEDGLDKELAQINANYDAKEREITKRETELKKLQGGKLTDAQTADFTTLRASNDAMRAKAIEKAQKEAMDKSIVDIADYYIAYGNLQEKILQTTKKYSVLIANAQNEGERKSLEAERDALLAEYQVAASDWANSLVDMTTAQLNTMLAELQAQVEAKEQAFNALGNSDSEDAKKYREEINKLKAQIAVLNEELGKTSRNVADKNWNESVQTFQNIANSAMEAADGIAEFDEGLGNSLRSISQFASAGLNLVVAIKAISDAAWTGATAISAMEKASLILAAISAAIQVVSAVVNAFKSSGDEVEQTKRQFKELNDELERLHKLARIDSVEGTIFGPNPFGNFINNLKAMQDALKDFEASKEAIMNKDVQYMDVVTGWNADGSAVTQKVPQGRQNLNDAISNMQVMTKHKTWFTDREYADLGDLVPDLFDEFGNVTLEGLQNLQNSDEWEKLSKKDRELIEQMISDWEDYNAAVEATEKYLSDVFGNLGSDITNALLDSFKNGTDAAEAFGEATGKILDRLASDIVNMALIQPIMDNAQKEVLELQKKLNAGEISYEEYLKQTSDILNNTINKAKGATEDAYDMYEAAGIEQDGSSSSSATSKGFQTMSQETGSELNGRFTDIQGQTHRIAEAVEFCKSLHIENLTQVQSINATVAMIHNDTSLIAQHTKVLANIDANLNALRRSVDNGAI
ncbi:MAG: tape measure protein [Alistipes sp.]|nr:tape measure protein [Alistipes sp.]